MDPFCVPIISQIVPKMYDLAYKISILAEWNDPSRTHSTSGHIRRPQCWTQIGAHAHPVLKTHGHTVTPFISDDSEMFRVFRSHSDAFQNLVAWYHSSSSSVYQVFGLLHSFLKGRACFRILSSSILNTCPNHLSLLSSMIRSNFRTIQTT